MPWFCSQTWSSMARRLAIPLSSSTCSVGAALISAATSRCFSCSPRFFFVYSVSLCMLCWLPHFRMKLMNSCTLTSADLLSSKAFQKALSSSSETTLNGICRHGTRRRTNSFSSSKPMWPDPSESTMQNNLYQLPPARCHFVAAEFISVTILVRRASSGMGQNSSSSLYWTIENSCGLTSPDWSGSMYCQKAFQSSMVIEDVHLPKWV
mmetsp:Transcript_16864/g.31377  ORF Transcript_16864/g.31377 Transcript_16864/m.31377 type:complete len:208 (-) Transcript_16864:1891-2514(-)